MLRWIWMVSGRYRIVVLIIPARSNEQVILRICGSWLMLGRYGISSRFALGFGSYHPGVFRCLTDVYDNIVISLNVMASENNVFLCK